ncbi:MAG: TlpA family protein disulfide reductase [Cyclobacteriaceae bacterium]|nr:TlpA family protein disulfide reductase [Cyclobacteriaceae bacterium]
MKRIWLVFLVYAGLIGCFAKKEAVNALKTGTWRAVINIQRQELPFNLDIEMVPEVGYRMYIINAEERILLDEITVTSDSVDIVLHLFDANIKARILGDTLRGEFILNYATDYRIPFQAVFGQSYRFEKKTSEEPTPDFSGKYSVQFIHETDTIPAVGIFEQHGDNLTGTFLTPTGDYRYLQGSVGNGGLFQLSTFDGNHAYLFTAHKEPAGKLIGEYYSGKTLKEIWIAEKNENAQLPDADKLTYLQEGHDRITFSFPDIEGKTVSLDDGRYKNKVVILQLFGTWCPNCLDETKFLTSWYDANKNRGVEIIGLAYERKDDFTYARDRVQKMIGKFDIQYDVVIAGTDDKAAASKTLPMLHEIISFPTTIFIGKDGKVKKIHTGFSGPGTGKYYEVFIQQFNETVNDLLKDDLPLM